MKITFDVPTFQRLVLKVYDAYMEDVRCKYELTSVELIVLGFLHNHKDLNSAKYIAEYRNISKGNVSCAINSLIKNGYLEKQVDPADRRVSHLFLTKESEPIVEEIDAQMVKFGKEVFKDFSKEEIDFYFAMNERVVHYCQTYLENNIDEQ